MLLTILAASSKVMRLFLVNQVFGFMNTLDFHPLRWIWQISVNPVGELSGNLEERVYDNEDEEDTSDSNEVVDDSGEGEHSRDIDV